VGVGIIYPLHTQIRHQIFNFPDSPIPVANQINHLAQYFDLDEKTFVVARY